MKLKLKKLKKSFISASYQSKNYHFHLDKCLK